MAKKTQRFAKNPGMLLLVTFIVLYIVNSLTLSVAASIFPEQIVLGTMTLSRTWAILLSMGEFSIIATFAVPLIREWELRRGKMLKDMDWMILYFFLNAGVLWVISRFAEQFGLGVASWLVVVALALVFDIVQGLAMMLLEKWRKS